MNLLLTKEFLDQVARFVQYYDPHNITIAAGIQGGYVRGTADEHSDIDLVFVFKNRNDAERMPVGTILFEQKKFGIRHLYMAGIDINQFSAKIRYVYTHETYVLYDKVDAFSYLIDKMQMSSFEKKQIITFVSKKLAIRGITYQGISMQRWHGINLDMPKEYWIEKRDLLSAHMRLTESIELITLLIFALNDCYLPSPKWRYNILQNLEWLPENFIDLYKNSLITAWDAQSHIVRQEALCKLFTLCIDYSKKENILPDDINMYYKNWFFKETDNPNEQRLGIKNW